MNTKYKKVVIISCLLIILAGVITFVNFMLRPEASTKSQ